MGAWKYTGSPYLEASPTAHLVESGREASRRMNPPLPLDEVIAAARATTLAPRAPEPPWISEKPEPPFRDPMRLRRR